MINIVVLLLSATNKETLYEQLVQPAGEREGCHGAQIPFFPSLQGDVSYFSCFTLKTFVRSVPFSFPKAFVDLPRRLR